MAQNEPTRISTLPEHIVETIVRDAIRQNALTPRDWFIQRRFDELAQAAFNEGALYLAACMLQVGAAASLEKLPQMHDANVSLLMRWRLESISTQRCKCCGRGNDSNPPIKWFSIDQCTECVSQAG